MSEYERECEKCKGVGEIPCENCDGEGMIHREAAHAVDLQCNACDGTGNMECYECDGWGHIDATITIDGTEHIVDNIVNYGYLPMIDSGKMEFYVAEDAEAAGQKAREYWKDMAENDPREFTAIIGEETLIAWALGQSAGPGSTHVNYLEEWLDLWLDTPEEEFASYDGCEREVTDVDEEIVEELGFKPTVAYRHN